MENKKSVIINKLKELDNSSLQRIQNQQDLKYYDSELNRKQMEMLGNLDEHLQQQVLSAIRYKEDQEEKLLDEISNLDKNDKNIKLNNIELDNKIIENRLNFTNFFKNILSSSNVPVFNDQRLENFYLQTNIAILTGRNNLFTTTDKDKAKEIITLKEELVKEQKNSGSLIDDFADTSTEMPSYMDPED